jgi:hypothetical protein
MLLAITGAWLRELLLQQSQDRLKMNKNKFQLSPDVINIGDLFNSDWGKKYTLLNQQYSLINYPGVTASRS